MMLLGWMFLIEVSLSWLALAVVSRYVLLHLRVVLGADEYYHTAS